MQTYLYARATDVALWMERQNAYYSSEHDWGQMLKESVEPLSQESVGSTIIDGVIAISQEKLINYEANKGVAIDFWQKRETTCVLLGAGFGAFAVLSLGKYIAVLKTMTVAGAILGAAFISSLAIGATASALIAFYAWKQKQAWGDGLTVFAQTERDYIKSMGSRAFSYIYENNYRDSLITSSELPQFWQKWQKSFFNHFFSHLEMINPHALSAFFHHNPFNQRVLDYAGISKEEYAEEIKQYEALREEYIILKMVPGRTFLLTDEEMKVRREFAHKVYQFAMSVKNKE